MPQFAEPVPGSGGKAFQVRQDGERVRLELTEAHGILESPIAVIAAPSQMDLVLDVSLTDDELGTVDFSSAGWVTESTLTFEVHAIAAATHIEAVSGDDMGDIGEQPSMEACWEECVRLTRCTVAVYRRSDRHCVVADLRRRELLQTTADGSGSNVTMFLMETRRTSWRQQKNLLGF
eukprot:g29837.t1